MLHFKTAKEQRALYTFGMGLLITGVLLFGSILCYAFLNADQHSSFNTTLSTMNTGVFSSIALMILGTIIRGVKTT